MERQAVEPGEPEWVYCVNPDRDKTTLLDGAALMLCILAVLVWGV